MKKEKTKVIKRLFALLLTATLIFSNALPASAETETTPETYDSKRVLAVEYHVVGSAAGDSNNVYIMLGTYDPVIGTSSFSAIKSLGVVAGGTGGYPVLVDYPQLGLSPIGSTYYADDANGDKQSNVRIEAYVSRYTYGSYSSLRLKFDIYSTGATKTVTTPWMNFGYSAGLNQRTYSDVTNVYVNYVPPQTLYHNPIVTAHPDMVKTLGDSIGSVDAWSDGITATWGKTTANTIPTKGKVTDDSLSGVTDAALSTTGTTFDRIGWKTHNYTIEDSHALDNVIYPGDNTSATTTRKVIVKSSSAPVLAIKYAAGAVDVNGTSIAGNPYTGTWTNQKLDVTVSTTDSGTYDATLLKNDTEDSFTNNATHIKSNYWDESPLAGDKLSGILLGVGDHSIKLSPETAKQTVKIDKTDPVPKATYTAATGFTDTSTDALSGINASRQKIAIVPTGGSAPATGAYTTFSALDTSTPGFYDVYVWAWDNAGNDKQDKVLSNIHIKSTQAPNISGKLASGPSINTALASNTWTNQDVTVSVTCPSTDIPGSHFNALYNGAALENKGASAHNTAQKTYTGEADGVNLHGVQVDGANNELSARTGFYVLRIDKTLPVGNLIYNKGVPNYGFTDKSTDTASAVANSGVNNSKTKVAMVPSGSVMPLSTAYTSITGAQIPNNGKYYDVWVIAYDNAGNESIPVKALEHISYNGKDEIKAKDFVYAIGWGSSALTDDMAKMLSHVEAIYEGGGAVPLANIDVDATQLAAIKAAITAGKTGTVWPLTFKTQGANSGSVTINVTLYDEGSQPNTPPGPLTHDLIYANDFTHIIEDGAISKDQAKILAETLAYDKNGNSIPRASLTVDTNELKAINDSIAAESTNGGTPFPLTFTSPDGTAVTIQVTLDELTKYPVTIEYRNRDNSVIKTAITVNRLPASSYTAAAPAIPNYVFVDWKQDGGALKGNKLPQIIVPSGPTTITLIYGDDLVDGNDNSGSDGIEDFKITKKYEKADGTPLKASEIKSVNKDKTFQDAHANITGYTFDGHKVDSGSQKSGEPSFKVTGKHTVTYLYKLSSYKVTIKYEDRDGKSIKADTSANANHGSSYTATAPTIADHVFVDWKQDSGSLKGNTTPTITNVTKATTITLVYGDDLVDGNNDPGSDGIEDFKITKKYETAAGASVKAPEVKSINKGKVFADPPATVTGFTYDGHKIGSGSQQGGNPSFTVTGKETVTYIYKATDFTITTEYEDRDGNSIQTPSVTVQPFGSTYTIPTPAITGYVFVDWKQDGGSLKGNKTPKVTVPAKNTTITLIYGDDKADGNDDPGSDGIEDFKITKKYQKADGTTLKADETKYVNKDKTFADTHSNITGYSYKGHKIGSGSQQSGEPSFKVTGKETVTYVYGEADFTVTLKYEDREGNTIKAATTASAKYNSSYTATAPAISKYIFVDWKQDGGTLKGNKTPKITMPAKNTTITLVYGQDKGGNPGDGGKTPDGIEDYTITESHRNGLGSKLCADMETYVNVGDTYKGKSNASLLSLGYVYEGYKWDSDAEVLAPALPTKTNITAKHTVVYRYSPNEYPVNVTYEYKDGTALSGSQSELIVHGDNFNKTSTPKLNIPAFSEKVLINWKLDGTLQNNANPGLTNVTRYHNIVLIYGQDKGGGGSDGKTPDGIEDYTITEKFVDGSSNTIASDRTQYVNKGTTYTGTPKKITGFTYKDYQVDGGAAATGNPTLKNIQTDHEITMNYGVAEYKVVVKAVTSAGKSIQNGAYDWTDTVKHKDSYAMKIPAIKNMKFQYWTLNGTKQSGDMIKIASVESNAAVKLYYAAAEPAQAEDYGNYEFVKTPNVKSVSAGQTVDYTFSGFGNKWPVALNNYSIADKPDKGLDFKSASLPAFKNGKGVTYDVVYYTNKQSSVTLYSNVPADKAFSFRAPSLDKGEYITGVILNFGTVPSGFGVGDTFRMSFRVWDNPPKNTLTNMAYLTYDINGKTREFATGAGTGTVYLSGWFSAARTGDSANAMPFAILLVAAAGILAILGQKERKRRQNEKML